MDLASDNMTIDEKVQRAKVEDVAKRFVATMLPRMSKRRTSEVQAALTTLLTATIKACSKEDQGPPPFSNIDHAINTLENLAQ